MICKCNCADPCTLMVDNYLWQITFYLFIYFLQECEMDENRTGQHTTVKEVERNTLSCSEKQI